MDNKQDHVLLLVKSLCCTSMLLHNLMFYSHFFSLMLLVAPKMMSIALYKSIIGGLCLII